MANETTADVGTGAGVGLVTADEIQAYRTDGVVCLRQAFSGEWIERLQEAIDLNTKNPTDRGRFWWRSDAEADSDAVDDGAGSRESGNDSDNDSDNDADPNGDGAAGGASPRQFTIYDSQAWLDFPGYRSFIEESPMAEIAGRLMESASVNFFFDAIFVRSPGVQFRTPFHQDEPYWSVSGFDCCSAWMPLDPVEKRSSLEFVRGSHVWPERFEKTNFGALTADERDQIVYGESAAKPVPFPDVEGDRDSFDILSWEMEPGDVVVFNARMIHGGSGLLRADRGLRVFNTQWIGDDGRVIFRPEGMDPDHRAVMVEHDLAPGDRLRGPLYPELWTR